MNARAHTGLEDGKLFSACATAAILLASVTAIPAAANSPIDPTGEAAAYYLERACTANAAVDRADEASWWMTYGVSSQPNGTPTTSDYRAAAEKAADALESAANAFGNREWPVSLHGSMNQRIEALYATAAETLDTYGHLWPDSDDRTRQAASTALWVPELHAEIEGTTGGQRASDTPA